MGVSCSHQRNGGEKVQDERKFNLYQCIALANLSIKEFADTLGVSESTVRRWISDKNFFKLTTVENLKKIATLAKVPMDSIDV